MLSETTTLPPLTPELSAAIRRSTSTLLTRTTRRFLRRLISARRNGPSVSPHGQRGDAFVGRFSFLLVPFFRWLLERYRDPRSARSSCKKSAQVGWTQSVICNLLGYFAHVEKTTCVAMFPKEGSARNFDREKFEPMVESTPRSRELMPRSRA
jgi:hypothetical protein